MRRGHPHPGEGRGPVTIRHPGEGRGPERRWKNPWIPAFAGMTNLSGLCRNDGSGPPSCGEAEQAEAGEKHQVGRRLGHRSQHLDRAVEAQGVPLQPLDMHHHRCGEGRGADPRAEDLPAGKIGRLEAVRALSFFDSQAALDVAVQSLIHEQDDYLEYVFKETTATLDERIKRGGK